MFSSAIRLSLKRIQPIKAQPRLRLLSRHLSSTLPPHQQHQQHTMRVKLVPALKDNYMYLLIDDTTSQCAVVDPVEPDKILEAARQENVDVRAVLSTHHHWDHSGGNKDLVQRQPSVKVYGGDDRIDCLTDKVQHDDTFKLGNLDVRCLFTPCHTSGHICYHVTNEQNKGGVVFTGDTLFVGGCGRFFEGKPEQMYRNLIEVLGSLPPCTKVYCGHEYTVANLMFAKHVEPDNEAIQKKITWAEEQRAKNLPTIPSTIVEEFTFNPFMRIREPDVRRHTNCTDPVEVMAALRAEKDNFVPKKH